MTSGTEDSKFFFSIHSSKPVSCYHLGRSVGHFYLQNVAHRKHHKDLLNEHLKHTAVINEEFKELSLDDFNWKYLLLFLDFTFVQLQALLHLVTK